MSARKFVKNADGKVTVEVISYQDIERGQIEKSVADAQEAYDAANKAVDEANDRLDEAETRLEEAKSELQGYDAAAQGTGIEAGPEGASSENPAQDQAPAEF
jgi:chromosome segregation ATPase